MTRAKRFAETFLELGQFHENLELMSLAAEIEETFVRRGREMTTTDETAALDAAAATFRQEVNREDHRRARQAHREQAPSRGGSAS